MTYQFAPNTVIEALGFAARPVSDRRVDQHGNKVLLALDVRGQTTAKVIEAALVKSADEHVNDKVYQSQLQGHCWGTLGFAVVEAYNLSLLDGSQTVIEVMKAVSCDLWATIRRQDCDGWPVHTSVTQIGGEEFIGPVSDPYQLPPDPGVLILVDQVVGVAATVAVESVSNLQMAVADHHILQKYNGRFYGEPGFVWLALTEAEKDRSEEIVEETSRLLLGTTTT